MNQSWYENSLYKVISDRLVPLQMMIRNYLYYAIIFWWGYKVRMYSVKVRLCELPRFEGIKYKQAANLRDFLCMTAIDWIILMCDYAFLGVHGTV
jgi:hypothetical protein